ncbi:MAG: hypothetical protein D6725_15500 [Planctomycetota bacterium]|nr:MAG: hypothetical protein D6725_15500 [Planctomycetota bacterium]
MTPTPMPSEVHRPAHGDAPLEPVERLRTDSRPTPTPRRSWWSRLERFFFEQRVPYGMAAVRILLCATLLCVVLPRWFHAREFYSTDGAPAPLADNYGWMDFLPIPSGPLAVALMSLLAFALISALIGWHTRLSLGIAAVVYPYLNMLDCLSSMTKYSVISSHALLLLALSRCGDVWSVDAWRRGLARRRSLLDPAIRWPRSPIWPQRLMQLMIGIVYFGAALTKMQTPEYFNGDQLLYWLMSNVNNDNPVGEWLTLTPWILVFFAYIAVVWEVLFPFLVWQPRGRLWMLGIGALFHIMTTLTLGLFIFPAVCISIYFCFLTERDVRRALRLVRRWRRRLKVRPALRRVQPAIGAAFGRITAQLRGRLGPATYAAVAGTAVVLGLIAEYALDPYGLRRPEGPYALQPLSQEEVARMLSPSPPIRHKDKLVAFDVGTWMISELMVNRRTEFRHGEYALAQVRLAPPHEDLWVECNLHDAEDRVLDRVGQIVTRSMTRASFIYRLTNALEPGVYQLVCRINGTEVARKAFRLHGQGWLPATAPADAEPPSAQPLEHIETVSR